MIKNIIILLSFFLVNFVLSAETVLLYTISDAGIIDEQQYGDLIESSVMNEFFDAGHIIFNADVSGDIPDRGLDHYKEPEAMQMAKAGGASFVLEVKLVYDEVHGKNLPGFANFRFIDVLSGDLLNEGSVKIAKKWVDKDELEDGLTEMGASMADSALNFL